MSKPLDLHEIEARYSEGFIDATDGLWKPGFRIDKDVKTLIDEIKRLRGWLEDIQSANSNLADNEHLWLKLKIKAALDGVE